MPLSLTLMEEDGDDTSQRNYACAGAGALLTKVLTLTAAPGTVVGPAKWV